MTYRYIYKITCTTGSLKDKFYYGQHTTDNLDDGYKGSGVMIQRYYKKHPNDYIKEIISYHENKSELDNAEISIISKYINDDNCLNLSPGGFGGSVKGIKNPNYGKHLSEETKKKLSEAHKGKPSNLSEESRNKISEVHKNQIPWNKGKKLAWITLNNNHKQIKEEELQKYIDAGWHRGRK